MNKVIKNLKSLSKLKKAIIIASATIFLAGVGFSVWYFWISPDGALNSRNDKQKIQSELSSIAKQSNAVFDNEGYNKYAQKIDNIIKNYNLTDGNLYDLYSSKAVSAINSENYQSCYESALRAFEIKNTSDMAVLAGNCLAALGRKDEAITYYEKAISLITDTDELSMQDKAFIKSKINELNNPTAQ